jgi:hypothetical protein
MRDQRRSSSNCPATRSPSGPVELYQPQLRLDERGCWFFQNGPQRVYVKLEATPYIARSDPQHGFVLQTARRWHASSRRTGATTAR